jgi:hypothetical protein
MSKNKKPDPAAELAEQMLRALEAQRSIGGEAYPPTLQHLGDMCEGSPTSELIVKAATKKPFKDKTIVDQAGKESSLQSEVYFKEDRPRPEVRLARRMLDVLESQRRLGEEAYPPTLRRLAELSDFRGGEGDLRKAAATAPMAGRATVVARKGKTLIVDAPVVLDEDIEPGLARLLSGLLRFALSPQTSMVKKEPVQTTAFTPAEVVKRVIPELKPRLEETLNEGLERQSLPRGIGLVLIKGKPLLFMPENLEPSAPRPSASVDGHVSMPHGHETVSRAHSDDAFQPRDFTQAFRAAFEILDRRNGSTNFVKLADLRQALADFSRDDFDAGLRGLRMDGVFSLDSHEGLHGSLSHEEREAGVREAGSLLVYASRR